MHGHQKVNFCNQSVVRLAIKATNYASTGCYVSVGIALFTFAETLYAGFSVFTYCVKLSVLVVCLIIIVELSSLNYTILNFFGDFFFFLTISRRKVLKLEGSLENKRFPVVFFIGYKY